MGSSAQYGSRPDVLGGGGRLIGGVLISGVLTARGFRLRLLRFSHASDGHRNEATTSMTKNTAVSFGRNFIFCVVFLIRNRFSYSSQPGQSRYLVDLL